MPRKLARIVLAALAASALALALAPSASAGVPLAAQASTVGQGRPVSATASDRTFTRFDIQWNAECTNGTAWSDRTLITNVAGDGADNPVDQGGYSERPGTGGTADVAWTLAGISNLQTVSGTFSAVINVRDGSGAVVNTCTTGVIGWDLRFRSACGLAQEGPTAEALLAANGIPCTTARRFHGKWASKLTPRLLHPLIPTRAGRLGPQFRIPPFACRGKAGIVAAEHTIRCTASAGRRSFQWVSFVPDPDA